MTDIQIVRPGGFRNQSVDAGRVFGVDSIRAGDVGQTGIITGPVLIPPAWVTHPFESYSVSVPDGDPVGNWIDDLLGAEFTATGSQRPTYRAGGGVPYLEWDGIDDFMSSTISSAQPNTLVAFGDFTFDGSERFIFDGAVTHNALYFVTPDTYRLNAGNVRQALGLSASSGPQMLGAVYNGGASFARRNMTNSSNANAGTAALGSLTLGRGTGSGANGIKGKLYGVFLGIGHLGTSSDLDDLYAYCQARFPGVLP